MTETNHKTVDDLSREEQVNYAIAVLHRGAERVEIARQAFRAQYPAAPEEMISAAVFHVYVDGLDAAMQWLADAERFLRDPKETLNYGITWHLLHHVYNWHMLEALMPVGRNGLDDLLDQIQTFADEGDAGSIRSTISQIKKMLDGDEEAPRID